MDDKQVKHLLKNWKLHAVVFCIVLLTEFIGPFYIKLGIGIILLLPMLYAFLIGLLSYFSPLIQKEHAKNLEPIIVTGVTLTIAKTGVVIGPQLQVLLSAGPALLLQELGHIGTIILALPIAMLLGFKREAIGMTHSIGREPNVGLITNKYGFNSPEGHGVMAIYIFGTVFGALFFGVLAGLLATFKIFHPYSLAMASGIGSGSMMAASSGALVASFPSLQDEIIAFAGASNLISLSTGLYVSMLISLPLTEKTYNLLDKRRMKKKDSVVKEEKSDVNNI
ncbi:DUF3100 domain-containing protein [Bacillus cytotoxicus]|uniref:DUF3100 domain-containing protein n=2 Tax=Bacillus cytotoxicus TaxID=580165 RepID=A0AAX2CD04_9BACI|nr:MULTISPECIES: DUF3100 domain-containing protein [Bacillus cereus group]ABS20830.1 conserved hypothetical protein [Bacillus cytotoxicus NVH 391-98]AWC31481.1 DUF3100 domain-containing protein [Bacillus cytotoxicus]AWC35520.1 DUF3100 domain-containing protein [Bacillus cytotoxicus]AWC43567.1 DUF3100 domain-containing protein [Bacillus cytotoxicus]AWC59751.1 DUF3100 domain-containing protein [Bacillus cytotoxicus]